MHRRQRKCNKLKGTSIEAIEIINIVHKANTDNDKDKLKPN